MVGVEHALGARQVDDLLGALRPRHGDEPVDVGARHRVFGRGSRHLGQPIELPQRFLLHVVRHAGGFDLLAELVELLGLLVSLAQLLLDRLHLLAKEVLALVLPDLGLHLGLDLRTELEHLQLLRQDAVELVHPGADVERLEQLLLGGGVDGGQAGRDEIRQARRIGDVRRQRRQVVGQHGRELDDLLEIGPDVPLQRVDLDRVRLAEDLHGLADLGAEVGLGRERSLELQPREALHDEPQASVRQLEHLVDVGQRPNWVQIRLAGLFLIGLVLGEHPDQLAARNGLVNQLDGALPRHSQRHEGIGEEDGVAERQHRHVRGDDVRPLSSAVLGTRRFVGHNATSLVAWGRRAGASAPTTLLSIQLGRRLPEGRACRPRHRRSLHDMRARTPG